MADQKTEDDFDEVPTKIDHNPNVIAKKIDRAQKSSNPLYALLLEASAIEGYMSDMILLYRNNTGSKTEKDPQNSFNRLGFWTLLSLNHVLGNIENSLYKRLDEFRAERNKFAHNMIGYDIEEPKSQKKLEDLKKEGYSLYKEISEIYDRKYFLLKTGSSLEEDDSD